MELKGESVDKWTICDLIDSGKTAAVFAAKNGVQDAALKVFDSELVDRYGKHTQLNRIARELSLADHRHPNLVEIYDGGECRRTGLLYVAMERIDAPSLALVLEKIARSRIRDIIRDVASAARFLETLNIAHRDIKPANIAVTDEKAVLLDLGVIRAISNPGGTDDDDARKFVGTLQYSPPEFLLRTEEDSIDGWRAVTFYQMGAVLHDLIERKTIFSDALDPYARLVNAVQQESTDITASDVPSDLISLAQRCLVKDPTARLNLVSWNDFEFTPSQSSPREAAREAILKRLGVGAAEPLQPDIEYERSRLLRTTAEEVRDIIRNACISEALLPPLRMHELRTRDTVASFAVTFSPDLQRGLNVYFILDFLIDLVDVNTCAVIVNAAARLDTKRFDPTDNENPRERIYAGFVEQESMGDAVLDFLLPAYEKALTLQGEVNEARQQICITGTDGKSEI